MQCFSALILHNARTATVFNCLGTGPRVDLRMTFQVTTPHNQCSECLEATNSFNYKDLKLKKIVFELISAIAASDSKLHKFVDVCQKNKEGMNEWRKVETVKIMVYFVKRKLTDILFGPKPKQQHWLDTKLFRLITFNRLTWFECPKLYHWMNNSCKDRNLTLKVVEIYIRVIPHEITTTGWINYLYDN